ncbi:globin family protein [Aquimarina agarivorans]|uniref:globin family protein n=1 Tax=Aquimarina agarivorans TaxID=980584 RepID=UPI000248E5F7|nr:globin domain-containing protein [Aquimarina agarivorans]
MESKTIELVQGTFKQVAPIADQAAEIFYSKLFEKDPSLKPMFKGDMKQQGAKLMAMIGTAVNGLNNLEALVPAVQNLGKGHAGYGVEDKHYDTVGAALLETLDVGLGDAFTPEVKEAWTEVYTVLATTMKDAANSLPKEKGLTERKKRLVQSSFTKVAPIADKAAEIFYNKLFELDPSVKPMFKGDMKQQGAKLMSMIGTAVNGLDNLEAIVPAVQNLGKNHLAYGVKNEHYDTVGSALLYTLETGLGDDFTPNVKDAWTEVYSVLATTMKDAASTTMKQEPVGAAVTDAEKPWWKFW